jgi:hypothetical protein
MYFIAESGGELLGYAMAEDVGANAGHPATVERLYIRHDTDTPNRGRAVALALVSAVHAKTRAAPAADRDATLSLFERWGFVDMRALRMCLTSSSSDGRLLGGDALEW